MALYCHTKLVNKSNRVVLMRSDRVKNTVLIR